MSQDYTTELQPGPQRATLSQKKKKKDYEKECVTVSQVADMPLCGGAGLGRALGTVKSGLSPRGVSNET